MKKHILVLMSIFLMSFVLNLSAQLYDDQHQQIVAPFDQVVEQHQNEHQDIPVPGEDEDLKTQQLRYDEATAPLNQANQNHFQNDLFDPSHRNENK